MVFSKAWDEADKENRTETVYMVLFSDQGNQGVSDNWPNWDHQNKGEGGRRQKLTHYIIIILTGIQAAGKKPTKWNKIKEINQSQQKTLWYS